MFGAKQGNQNDLYELEEALRNEHPDMAYDLEGQPYYAKPEDFPDNLAVCNWAWTVEPNNVIKCIRTRIPITKIHLLKSVVLDEPAFGDADSWVSYTLNFRASYALAVLKQLGVIPADSVMVNEDDTPMSL